MINLLADVRKSEIMAARANVIILRYTGIILLAIIFMLGALAVSYAVLQSTMQSAESLIEANDVKTNVYSDTKEEVDALSSQLSDARTILSQEVRFSQVLLMIGQAMPEGAVIGQTELTADSFNGSPTTLTVYASSASNASTIQTQLQASPLFSSVNLQGTEENGGPTGYPAVITMTVTLNKARI